MASTAEPDSPRDFATTAWEDLVGGLRKTELWGRIGWLDVRRRYRRTVLGPFWSSITLGIYTLAVGVVGAGLFQQDTRVYLPYLSSGMVVWTLVSTFILEGCTLLVSGSSLFRNVRFEYSVLAYALVWRTFVIFLHNLVIFAIIVVALRPELPSLTTLLAIPGVALVLLNGVWIALLSGILCLRYRDIQQLAQTMIQILMLITPIFWTPEALQGTLRLLFVQMNPIYRLIDVVRAPLMGEIPTLVTYVSVLAIAAFGWGVTYTMFRSFRKRIAYWS